MDVSQRKASKKGGEEIMEIRNVLFSSYFGQNMFFFSLRLTEEVNMSNYRLTHTSTALLILRAYIQTSPILSQNYGYSYTLLKSVFKDAREFCT